MSVSESITKSALCQRGGIVKNKQYFLLLLLVSFYKENLLICGNTNIKDLARFIYDKQMLYKTSGKDYKLLSYKSILTMLRTYSIDAKKLKKLDLEKILNKYISLHK